MSENKDILRKGYEAFGRGDVPAVLALFSPDITWIQAEGFPYGGTFRGPDAVLQNVFMKLGTEWDGWTAAPDQLVAEGDTVVALGTYTGTFKATGKSIRAPFVHVWRLHDGKAVSFHQHTDTAVVQRALS